MTDSPPVRPPSLSDGVTPAPPERHSSPPTGREPEEVAPADLPPDARWEQLLHRPSLLGTVLAAWLFAESLAPSLLARSWLFQGIITGASVALGYAVGLGLTRLGKFLRTRFGWGWPPLAPRTDRTVRLVVLVLVAAFCLWAVIEAVPEHRWTWNRLSYEPSSFWFVYGGSLLLALVLALALFGLGRVLKLMWAKTTQVGSRMLPAWIAGGLALVLVAWVVTASLNTFVFERTISGINATFARGDLSLDDAPPRPESAWRSGGPDSQMAWDEIGLQGRHFLTGGIGTEELADFATGEVTEPIRVYAGRASADTVTERVDLVMDEMERFDAFDRDALLVVIPTGTGWINEQIVQPLEYFYSGDIATVSLQYSHLPSPLAFVSESAAAGETAAALLEAVEERLAPLGEDAPALYIAGESLGSFGGSLAFDSLEDSRERVAGAVWVGSPETNHLRREAERTREPGSLQIKPLVGDGTNFLFVNRPSDMAGVTAHSVFLQQADDPIVWWDWDLLLSEPDWLKEPLDPAVNPAMDWTPVATFLQVAVDMAVGNDFDQDHGHLYGTQPLSAWYAVVQPDGWDAERLESLRQRLAQVAR